MGKRKSYGLAKQKDKDTNKGRGGILTGQELIWSGKIPTTGKEKRCEADSNEAK